MVSYVYSRGGGGGGGGGDDCDMMMIMMMMMMMMMIIIIIIGLNDHSSCVIQAAFGLGSLGNVNGRFEFRSKYFCVTAYT